MLEAGGLGDVAPGGFQPSALVHRYAKALAREAPDVALEYYIQVSTASSATSCKVTTLISEGQLVDSCIC